MITSDLRYHHVEGSRKTHDVVLYGLYICQPCQEGQRYLEEHGYDYRHVIMERQPAPQRIELKKQFEHAYGHKPIYPVLQIDDELIFGYNPLVWEARLA